MHPQGDLRLASVAAEVTLAGEDAEEVAEGEIVEVAERPVHAPIVV
jgi:hypothetical protein